ncbi:uncharacterized protein JCM15063_002257 [Sporobolomyces koalae]|uniref:uncharacterized protein n=1 Tax=Sporobolomyces koalae TaxID=500713 RepID=UPI00317E60A6
MLGKDLDPSCYAGTFFEYCASSTAKEKCCGICTVVPIAYPGTLISFVLGSFCNLLYALIFRAEAPYNLLFQFLAVDAQLISLINLIFKKTNRVDLFAYCFVPLSICSSIPVAVAIALSRMEDLHVMSPAAIVELRIKSATGAGLPTDGDEITSFLRHRQEEAAASDRNQLTKPRKRLQKPQTIDAGTELTRRNLRVVPHPRLPEKLVWFYFGHLIVFTIVFGGVYFGTTNTSQENCNEQFSINSFWRPVMGSFAALNLLIGYWSCWIMHENVKHYHNPNHEFHRFASLSGTYRILRWTGNDESAANRDTLRKRERFTRMGICFFAWTIWAGPYLWIWFRGINEFLMLGPNPWLFEQVGAATSIFVPFLVVWRGVTDRKFQLAQLEMAKIARNKQQLEGAGPNPHGHSEPPESISDHRHLVHGSVDDRIFSGRSISRNPSGSHSV